MGNRQRERMACKRADKSDNSRISEEEGGGAICRRTLLRGSKGWLNFRGLRRVGRGKSKNGEEPGRNSVPSLMKGPESKGGGKELGLGTPGLTPRAWRSIDMEKKSE